MCFSGRLEIATGFSPIRYDSVHSKCYGHHIFPAEAVELVARFFCVVFYLQAYWRFCGFFYHHHTLMCFLAERILPI